MRAIINDKKFMRDMRNIVEYSVGFLDGVQNGKTQFLNNIGKSTIETLKQYVDSMARVDQQLLHHMYEWNRIGSPDARLFDVNHIVRANGISFIPTFRQSSSIKQGSKVPFYDKATIMENGTAVTIKPKSSQVLAFEANGETVFTKKEVKVDNPGGSQVEGSFEKTFDTFFRVYFTQAFLYTSGVADHIKNPSTFKRNLKSGKNGGRSVGKRVGYSWIAKAGVLR
jgi:hypothetical protein